MLSSDVCAYGGTHGRDSMPVGLRYFGEREVGGNPMVIGFGHSMFLFFLPFLRYEG